MAKKITFLLVLLFVLLLASVTAFADGTGSSSTGPGIATDKAYSDATGQGSEKAFEYIKALVDKNAKVFFDQKAASENFIVDVTYLREYNVANPLRHTFTGDVVNTASGASIAENPVVMLMYIKKDGNFVPLVSLETESNFVEGSRILCATVDLEYLGSNKVNEVRVIAFRKKDSDKLELGKNLQITDFQITVKKFNFIEKVKITYNEVVNLLNQTTN